ncbi:MAG: FeoA family protein [bacterium]|nr:FeoA family protein [bacterium]
MQGEGGTPLSELRRGSRAVVRVIGTPGSDRLFDFGLLPGTPVDVVLEAPLGDPLVIVVRGTLLSLRRRDAAGIIVATGETPVDRRHCR